MTKLKYIHTVILLFLIPTLLFPKDRDNELWGSVDVIIPVIYDFETSLSRQIRFFNDYKQIKWHITDLDLKYKFTKHFNLSLKYRYKYYQEEWQKVYYLNLRYNYKIWKIKTNYRFRLQQKNRFEQKENSIKRKRDEDFIRNRILMEYDTDEWIKPFIGIEIFYLFNNEKYTDRFTTTRYYIGTNIDLAKKHKIEIFYMIENEYHLKNSETTNVIGISYSYKLPKLFK